MINPAETAVAGRPRFAFGPEAVGAAMAVILIATVTGILARDPVIASPSTASQSPVAQTSVAPSISPTVNLADIESLLAIDARLLVDRAALQSEVAATPFEAANVAAILRGANADLLNAIGFAERLRANPLTAEIGGLLQATYADLRRQISDALANSVQNSGAYLEAASAISASLARLVALDGVLRSLRASAGRTPEPSPSARPPSIPPSRPPSSPVVGSPRPSASSGSPTTSAFVNPGFEDGVGPPWELLLGTGAAATLEPDRSEHVGGAQSARVVIAIPGSERAAVAVRQGGLNVQAGSHYVATIMVRAAETREVRIRIASADGETYGTRLYTVGPAWQMLTLDSTIFATDPNAYLQIDLGRFGATTWLDDAAFVQVAASG